MDNWDWLHWKARAGEEGVLNSHLSSPNRPPPFLHTKGVLTTMTQNQACICYPQADNYCSSSTALLSTYFAQHYNRRGSLAKSPLSQRISMYKEHKCGLDILPKTTAADYWPLPPPWEVLDEEVQWRPTFSSIKDHMLTYANKTYCSHISCILFSGFLYFDW